MPPESFESDTPTGESIEADVAPSAPSPEVLGDVATGTAGVGDEGSVFNDPVAEPSSAGEASDLDEEAGSSGSNEA